MKGKISGAIAGLLLTGNPVGMVAGGISGHFLVDASSIRYASDIVTHAGLPGIITTIILGYFRANKSLNRSALKHTKTMLSDTFKLDKEQQKIPAAIYKWAKKKLEPHHIAELVNEFLQQVRDENRVILLELIFYAAALVPPRHETAHTYVAYIEKQLKLDDAVIRFLKSKYTAPVLSAYRLLGISPVSSYEITRSRYVELARQYHPDNGAPEYEKEMKQINAAWNTIRKVFNEAHLVSV